MKRHTMYLDESGVASLTDKKYPDFLVTGLILDHEEDRELSAYFSFMKKRYKIPLDETFHSYDLFENKNSPRYLSDSNAKKLSESLQEFISICPIKIIVTALSKTDLKDYLHIGGDDDFKGSEQKKRDKELPYEVLAAYLFLWFGDFVKKEKSLGAIVAESRTHSDYGILKTYLNCKQADASLSKSSQKSKANLSDWVSSIRFENKLGLWPGLELADLFSYVSYLSLQGRLQKFRKRGIVPLWHTIEKKIEKRKIQKIQIPGFRKYIRPDRVRKIPKIT